MGEGMAGLGWGTLKPERSNPGLEGACGGYSNIETLSSSTRGSCLLCTYSICVGMHGLRSLMYNLVDLKSRHSAKARQTSASAMVYNFAFGFSCLSIASATILRWILPVAVLGM